MKRPFFQGWGGLRLGQSRLVARGQISDAQVLDVCRSEGRVLITFDLDFADIHAYPPASHAGIWVLRPRTQSIENTVTLLREALTLLEKEALQSISNQNKVERLAARLRQIQQSLAHRGGDVLGAGRAHASDSRYGRITFATRQTSA